MGTRDSQTPNLEGERADWEPFLKKQEVWTWSLLPVPGSRMGISTRESDPREEPSEEASTRTVSSISIHSLPATLMLLQTDCSSFPCAALPSRPFAPLPVLVRFSPGSRPKAGVISPGSLAELVVPPLPVLLTLSGGTHSGGRGPGGKALGLESIGAER